MNREDVRKLIGGYATGTLTEAERKLLFSAALEDQDLFDELAAEQGLKDLLEASGARARLLTAVAPSRRRQSWWAWGALAAAAAGLVLFVATQSQPEPPVEIAAARQEPAPGPAATPAVPERDLAAAPKGQQGAAQTAYDRLGTTPAPAQNSEKRLSGADQAAKDVAVAELQLQKVESAVPAAPPTPPAARTAAKGGAAGNAGMAEEAVAALARNEPGAASFSFTYERAADSLRIVPAAQGFLMVTAAGQPLFPLNSVLPGSNVIVPLPEGTGDVTIVFSASTGPPDAEAVKRDAPAGTAADPTPSPNSRLAIIVPALP